MSEYCQFLPWDSEFFGLRIAKVNPNQLNSDKMNVVLSWCLHKDIDCLYLLADSKHQETIRLAEAERFRLVDLRMTLHCRIDANSITHSQSKDFVIRPAQLQDIPALRAISRRSFTQTRYYADRCFPPEKCSELYEVWITKSFEGYANQVLVALIDNIPQGFITCHIRIDHSAGDVGLIGVKEETRGLGIGKALASAALSWYYSQGIQQVFVATQGKNYIAQNFFQSNGFDVYSMHIWYHKWFKHCLDEQYV
jgi:dTDP-4-amino-4,6-dideoxy-D-galactose acyltransferase